MLLQTAYILYIGAATATANTVPYGAQITRAPRFYQPRAIRGIVPTDSSQRPATSDLADPTSDGGDSDKTCPSGMEKINKVEDSPICDDAECNGPHDTEICIQGTYKDCPCLLVGKSRPGQVADKNWWDQQQQIIESVIANPDILGTAAPACTVNSNTHDFDGNPAQVPATWCVCNDEGQNKVYSTVNTPSSPCALTALPTATITISNIASTGGPITSCRIASMVTAGTTIGTWCTCNDNLEHEIDTWTHNGNAVTGCSETLYLKTTTAAEPTAA
ncbi:hypothetical protein BJ166DRAFT_606342 [Pestalotiopsis sp. NC0098]|nr:hypothetical protein BJ166DRAFT_606342 [Pestalotiopsis sp. NC0098]